MINDEELVDAFLTDMDEDVFEDAEPIKEETDVHGVLKDYFAHSYGTYNDTSVAEERAENLRYFYSKPLGNEKKGRSQYVTSDCRDAVRWMLPSLLNVFLSTDKIAVFTPSTAADIEQAQQQTDMVNHILFNENNAFTLFYTVLWDALVTNDGFAKYYYDETVKRTRETYTGVSEMAVMKLLDQPDIEVVSYEQTGSFTQAVPQQVPVPSQPSPDGTVLPPQMTTQMVPQTVPTYDITVNRLTTEKRYVVENVAPEDIIVHTSATSVEDTPFLAIAYKKTRSELIEMGYDADVVDGLPTTSFDYDFSSDEIERRNINDQYEIGSELQYYEIYECYARVDADGDGIDELHRYIVAGRDVDEILEDELVDFIPIAKAPGCIKPYSFFSTGIVSETKDIQKVNSTLFRNLLDYVYTVNTPRLEVVDQNIVNKSDLLSDFPGALIRTRAPGSINPVPQSPLPAEYFQLGQQLKNSLNIRTGVLPFGNGLNPEALNSNTATGVMDASANANLVQDLIARTFAETFVRDLFNGLRKLIIKHQDAPTVINLRGHFVEIDPTAWNETSKIAVNVGLGTGTAKSKANDMQQVMALQLQFMALNCATPQNVYNACVKYMDILGYKDTDTFFTNPASIPPAPPKPTPEEVDLQKIQADLQKAMIAADSDRYKVDKQAEVDLTELTVETALKEKALQIKQKTAKEGKSTSTRTDYFPGVDDD